MRRYLARFPDPPGPEFLDVSTVAAASRVAWWRADSGLWQNAGQTIPAVNQGDPVASWQTRVTPAATAAQATAANQPTLDLKAFAGRPSLQFHKTPFLWLGANSVAGAFSGVNLPFTWFLAVQPTAALIDGFAISVGKSNSFTPFNYIRCDPFGLAGYMSSREADSGSRADTAIAGNFGLIPHILTLLYDGSTMTLRDNGRVVASIAAALGQMTVDSFAIGALDRNNAPVSGIEALIAEVALFSAALNTVQLGQWENYLQGRYFAR